jgi:hypothetical protein
VVLLITFQARVNLAGHSRRKRQLVVWPYLGILDITRVVIRTNEERCRYSWVQPYHRN